MDGRLQVGGAISGHVTDDSGALTGDALVDIWGPRGGFDDEAVVQSDGSFLVTGLPTGLYRVCASWFPPFDGAAFVVGFSFLEECRSAPVSVTAGQTTTGVDRSVATGGSVRVSVHDADGRPVGGVDVAALSTCPSDDFCSTIPLFDPRRDVSVADSQVTAADGTVTLHGLPAGEYAICLFGYYGSTVAGSPRTGYADSCAGHSFNVEVTDHQTTEVARELDDGGMITGTITDAAGTPLAGVQVVVSHAATSDYVDAAEYDPFVPDGPAADAVTDAHGRFQVRGVTPGEQTVCANAVQATGGSVRTGYLDGCFGGSTAKTATPVAVQADASTDVRFSLAAGAAISGRVTLASGHTQFIEVVAIRGRHGYVTGVARNGDYRIVRLPAGTYQVCFLAFRYQSQCFDDVRWRDGRRIPRAAARIVLAAGTERRGVGAVLRRAK